MIYNGIITISNVSEDPVYGGLTDTNIKEKKAYIESASTETHGNTGQPTKDAFLFLLKLPVNVYIGDKISIIKIQGRNPEGKENGNFRVKKIERLGRTRTTHIEVTV